MKHPDRKILYEYTDRSCCCLFYIYFLGWWVGVGALIVYLLILAGAHLGWLVAILLLIPAGILYFVLSITTGFPFDLLGLLLAVPFLRLRAWENRISMSHGIFLLPRITINKEEILHIGATPEKLEKYTGRLGLITPKGWTNILIATSARGLMIVTSKGKYLVACPDPDKAAARLTEIFGPWKSEIELPEMCRKQGRKSDRKR
jgi:hypothetical protein